MLLRTCLTMLLPVALWAQPFVPRNNYSVLLEPNGVIMHGAGQDPVAFQNYASVMPATSQPLVFMTYLFLNSIQPNWSDSYRAIFLQNPNQFMVLEVGLELNVYSDPTTDYETQVAAGAYDTQTNNFIAGAQRLATPIYLRIGAEFNGSWEGYQKAPFQAAYRRIVQMIRAADVEVASVWCISIGGAQDYFDWYPGDDVVDWFGIDLFTPGDFTNPGTASFLAAADAHGKPVMLGETTPESVGANQPNSWTAWYGPFFAWLAANPGVKQFDYIDWNWAVTAVTDNQPGWANWGDARLETPDAAPVLAQYVNAIADPAIQSSSSETAFRQTLNYDTTITPPTPNNLTAAGAPGGVAVNWDPVPDSNGIARYYITRDGSLIDFTPRSTLHRPERPAGLLHLSGRRHEPCREPEPDHIAGERHAAVYRAHVQWQFLVRRAGAMGTRSVQYSRCGHRRRRQRQPHQ